MDIFSRQFGLVVAYLLPGFIALAGIARFVPTVQRWLLISAEQDVSGLGPPLYAILAATAMGMVMSCFRWILIDHLLQATGVTPPAWDIDRLETRLSAFTALVEFHYRYYQFYANTLIAAAFAYLLNRLSGNSALGVATDIGVAVLCGALLFGARDALKKYYSRTGQLIGRVTHTESKG